jgi:dienelactone hydrolase
MIRRLGGFAAIAAFVAAQASAETRAVTLTASDGVSVTAAVYEPFHVPAPAVILLHMLGRSRADWHEAAERLNGAGFLVLAVDFRWIPASTDQTRDLRPLLLDARAALAYLRSRDDVTPARVGLGGASVGASVAAMVAPEDPNVRAVALVSPALDYRGLRCEAALRKFTAGPVLLLAAASDPYAVRSVKQLATGGPNREVMITDAPGHGSILLGRQPELVDRLVDWFRRTLL